MPLALPARLRMRISRTTHGAAHGAAAIGLALSTVALSLGCKDRTPPPPRVPVPPSQQTHVYERDPVKPLPDSAAPQSSLPAPPFQDEPLINQRPPEQPAFLDAYTRVGRPRMVVFVNRTLDGQIVPVTANDNVGRARNGNDDYQDAALGNARAGHSDNASPKTLDYEAMETILTDLLSCNGQTLMTSPTLARQHLTDQQVQDLQSGRAGALNDVAQQLNADVLVQAQAHPTRQSLDGTTNVRVVVEALNTRGGQSLGRAVVDIPPPLDEPQINRFTRFLARKLMDEMTGVWNAPPPPELRRDNPRESTAPPSATTTPGGNAPPTPTPQSSQPPPPAPSSSAPTIEVTPTPPPAPQPQPSTAPSP